MDSAPGKPHGRAPASLRNERASDLLFRSYERSLPGALARARSRLAPLAVMADDDTVVEVLARTYADLLDRGRPARRAAGRTPTRGFADAIDTALDAAIAQVLAQRFTGLLEESLQSLTPSRRPSPPRATRPSPPTSPWSSPVPRRELAQLAHASLGLIRGLEPRQQAILCATLLMGVPAREVGRVVGIDDPAPSLHEALRVLAQGLGSVPVSALGGFVAGLRNDPQAPPASRVSIPLPVPRPLVVPDPAPAHTVLGPLAVDGVRFAWEMGLADLCSFVGSLARPGVPVPGRGVPGAAAVGAAPKAVALVLHRLLSPLWPSASGSSDRTVRPSTDASIRRLLDPRVRRLIEAP